MNQATRIGWIVCTATWAALTGVQSAEVIEARADVKPTEGNTVAGTVFFVKVEDGVNVRGHFTGLTVGPHGFHIHDVGDCSAADASSAGAHFNPHEKAHGAPDAEECHAGDLGNLNADEDGEAQCNFVSAHLRLHGEASIVGRSVLVHADADDLTTQPSGNSGARIGCGVVVAVEEADAAEETPAAAEPAPEETEDEESSEDEQEDHDHPHDDATPKE